MSLPVATLRGHFERASRNPYFDLRFFFHILFRFLQTGREIHRKLVRSFIPYHFIILGEQPDPARICEFSRPSQTSVISVPDLAPADRVLKIKNSRHKSQNTRDKGRLMFHSYSKWMRGLPM